MEYEKFKLLDKIITLYSWSVPCLNCIVELASNGDRFANTMASCEDLLAESEEDNPLPQAQTTLNNEACHNLYLAAVASTPLFRLMKSEPLFSKASPVLVATLAQFADIRPDPETILRTRDTTFMRILKEMSQQETVSYEDLLRADLTKLITFFKEHIDIAAHLRELASTPEWRPQLLALEAELDSSPNAQGSGDTVLGQDALDIRDQLRNFAADTSPTNPLKRFLAPPRFSTMLREEMLAFWDVRLDLSEPKFNEKFENLSPEQLHQTMAADAVNQLPAAQRDDINLGFCVRQEAIRDFLALRRFAKLDALEKNWPLLAKQLEVDGSVFLRTLEGIIVEPESASRETIVSVDRYLQDGQLVRFMKLRPLFRDIYQVDVKKQFEVSQIVAKTSEPKEAAAQVISDLPKLPYEPEQPYQNVFVRIYKEPDAEGSKAAEVVKDEADKSTYIISISDGSAPFEGRVTPTDTILEEIRQGLVQAFSYRQTTRELLPSPPRALDTAAQLRTLGTLLYESFFPDSLGQDFSSMLESSPKRRILLELNDPMLGLLPWECLYPPQLRTFLALVKKCSIVRRLPDARSLIPRTLRPPLRILMVIAQPKDAPFLQTERERDVLSKAVAEAISDGRVELQVLEHATLSELQHYLRVFKPHLFHFVGHGVYLQDEQKGVLVFEDEQNQSRMVSSEDLKTLLVDHNISLAVLNACDTGAAGTNDVVTGVAGALVTDGIPAAVATLRPVFDSAALMFTREFYRSLVDGYPLESAIIEARKALSIEKWDWPAYALFSGVTELDSLRLIGNREVA